MNENNIFNSDTIGCSTLYTVNISFNAINSVYVSLTCVIQLYKVFELGKKFFIEYSEELTAKSDDPDVIVLN